jgi:hypothetical protein
VRRCPICRRTCWFSDEAVAHHVEKEHADAIGRCEKVRYRTDLEALDALIKTKRRPSERRRETRRYHCGTCGGWHLTSRPIAGKAAR